MILMLKILIKKYYKLKSDNSLPFGLNLIKNIRLPFVLPTTSWLPTITARGGKKYPWTFFFPLHQHVKYLFRSFQGLLKIQG